MKQKRDVPKRKKTQTYLNEAGEQIKVESTKDKWSITWGNNKVYSVRHGSIEGNFQFALNFIKRLQVEIQPLTKEKRKKRIFLSGPMTGIKDFNFPLFNAVAEKVRGLGFEVVNPVDICKKFKKERVLADKTVFEQMINEQQEAERTCDILMLLPGWENSKGVRLELKTALEMGLPIILEGIGTTNKLKSLLKNKEC